MFKHSGPNVWRPNSQKQRSGCAAASYEWQKLLVGKNCSRISTISTSYRRKKTPSWGLTWKYSQYDTYVDFASSMRPWRPKLENCVSYRRRHGAPPATPRRGNIVQHTIQQGCIVKTIVEKPRHPLDGSGRHGRKWVFGLQFALTKMRAIHPFLTMAAVAIQRTPQFL